MLPETDLTPSQFSGYPLEVPNRTGCRLRVSLHLGTGRIIRADAHDADAMETLRMQALGVVPADPRDDGTFYLVSSR